MASEDHENYARALLLSLSDDHPEMPAASFAPNPGKSRNAARAMTAIICDRLIKNSDHRPVNIKDTIYEWKNGTFNCRNIADRDYLWTNIRRRGANEMHDSAK